LYKLRSSQNFPEVGTCCV